ncbi:MAG: PQQ-binding-like beta-propeller repeat protein [Betaproteobacteria bacterium]|nr:PQQ-binding-like beta-propeller repeat protein [Betaproteobacteria bacterium]
MSNAFRLLAALLALAALPAAAQKSLVYVTNSAGDSIHVIDPSTQKVVQEIQGIEAAHGIGFSADASRVYVSNEAETTLDVFDQRSGKRLAQVPLSGHPNNIAVTKDGGRIVVGIAQEPGALDIVDARSLRVTKSIPVQGRLHNVYVTPDNKYAITGSIRTKVITVIDLATEQVAWQITLDEGIRPMAIEAGPDGSTRRIYAQLSNLNGFSVIDFASRKEVARIQLPERGFGVAERRMDSPSHGIGVAPDGGTLWVTSIAANSVFAYSLPELKLVGEVALPDIRVAGLAPISAVPNWVTFTPDSRLLYITNAAAKSVSVVDTRSMKLVATVPVGEVPKRLNTLVFR